MSSNTGVEKNGSGASVASKTTSTVPLPLARTTSDPPPARTGASALARNESAPQGLMLARMTFSPRRSWSNSNSPSQEKLLQLLPSPSASYTVRYVVSQHTSSPSLLRNVRPEVPSNAPIHATAHHVRIVLISNAPRPSPALPSPPFVSPSPPLDPGGGDEEKAVRTLEPNDRSRGCSIPNRPGAREGGCEVHFERTKRKI
eukprot:scaffold1211_cov295-Pavlova_lutheri.AAC.3